MPRRTQEHELQGYMEEIFRQGVADAKEKLAEAG